MKKSLNLIMVLVLMSIGSVSFATPRRGLYIQGDFGPTMFPDAEDGDPWMTPGVSLGYGLSHKVALAAALNVCISPTEMPNTNTKYILVGGDVLYFPFDQLGLYVGGHLGVALLSVSITGGGTEGYSIAGPAVGPKIGYELDLSQKFSCGFDFSPLYLPEATGTMDISGTQIEITREDTTLLSMLLYFKYYFSELF